jgi:hypothetical protein
VSSSEPEDEVKGKDPGLLEEFAAFLAVSCLLYIQFAYNISIFCDGTYRVARAISRATTSAIPELYNHVKIKWIKPWKQHRPRSTVVSTFLHKFFQLLGMRGSQGRIYTITGSKQY